MLIYVNGKEEKIPADADLYDAAQLFCENGRAALAFVDGKLRELHHRITEGNNISFVTTRDALGYEALRRSYSMLFFAAVKAVFGQRADAVTLHFSIGSGFYYTISGEVSIDEAFKEQITGKMLDMAEKKLPFRKQSIGTEEARTFFRENGMPDRAGLFAKRLSSGVNIYDLDGYKDYYYGFMLHDTEGLTHFEIIPYKEGVVLQMPEKGNPDRVPEFETSAKLFDAQISGEEWAARQNISCVSDLNRKIMSDDALNMILVSEAVQESRIAFTAGLISERPDVKFVMIAGPSSSGKTTFSQRLCIQLAAHGLVPHYVGVDNYFIDRDKMIPGPDGKLDFEALNCVDLELFNHDMMSLLNGETIDVPTYDFPLGKRVYDGTKLKLEKNELLVIEGIHCLNDEMSFMLPKESKFRIYISALSQINIDEHNRVPSSDGRLIRRIVRDHRTRGTSASKTIMMWDSVRDGERKNIFPFQESADIVFNSSLAYETAALKDYAEPLLFGIESGDPAYYEARRLLKFLDYFLAVPPQNIPANSILREFIGGGCFHM